MKPYLIILYLIALVAIGAAGDALNDEGIKTFGHLLRAFEIALLILAGGIFKLELKPLIIFLIAYICFRIVGFDYIYNWIRDIPLLEMGTSNWWDKALAKQLPMGVVFGRFIFLIVGISIPFKYLRFRP